MVLDPKETAVSYRCDSCGLITTSVVGIFSLSGDLIKLKCDCGESELVITRTKEGKIRLDVPCLFCGKIHTFTISQEAFFNRPLTELNCTYTAVPICFLGQKDKVYEAQKKSDELLNNILGDHSPSDIAAKKGQDERSITDAQISDIVRFILCELEDDGKLECGCPKGEGEIGFDFDTEGVTVYCEKCGRQKHFDINSTQTADDFLAIDSITLE